VGLRRWFGPRDPQEAGAIADAVMAELADLTVDRIRELPERRDARGANGALYTVVVEARREGDVWRIIVAVDDGGRWGIIAPLIRDEFRAV
jgi:hypothetical protein